MTKALDFGVSKEFTYQSAASIINNVSCINSFQFIASTNKNIVKFEPNNVFQVLQIPTQLSVYIPKYEVIVYMPKNQPVFVVNLVSQLKETIYTSEKVEILGPKHLIFSGKSDTLICFGLGIRTYHFSCTPLRSNFKSGAAIKERASFYSGYVASTAVPPVFDYNREQILLTTMTNILIYDLDGNKLRSLITIKSSSWHLFTVNPFNSNYLTSDKEQGLCYWDSNGRIIYHYSFTNAQMISAFFINSEFAFLVDSNFRTFIVNLETQMMFRGCSVEDSPRSIAFIPGENPYFVTCGLTTTFYKINTYFHLWSITSTPVVKMIRCPSRRKAARLLFKLSDSSFQFLSPRSAQIIGICHNGDTALPCDFFIQRDKIREQELDTLTVQFDDGNICFYQVSELPFSNVKTFERLGATSICRANIQNKDLIIVGTRFGTVCLIDLMLMKEYYQFNGANEKICRVFYHNTTNSIIVVASYYVRVFSATDYSLKFTINQENPSVQEFFWDLLISGYKDGRLLIQKLNKVGFRNVFEEQRPIHDSPVTSISQGSNFFITTGLDGYLFVWSQALQNIAKCKFPLQIYSSCALNGTRNILFSTPKHVMSVDGSLIFREKDEKDTIFDNYDERLDEMEPNKYQFTKVEDVDVAADFLRSFRQYNHDLKSQCRKSHKRSPKLNAFIQSSRYYSDPPSEPLNVDVVEVKEQQDHKKHVLSSEDKQLLLKDMLALDHSYIGRTDPYYVPRSNEKEPIKTHEDVEEYYSSYEEEEEEEGKEDVNKTQEIVLDDEATNPPSITEEEQENENDIPTDDEVDLHEIFDMVNDHQEITTPKATNSAHVQIKPEQIFAQCEKTATMPKKITSEVPKIDKQNLHNIPQHFPRKNIKSIPQQSSRINSQQNSVHQTPMVSAPPEENEKVKVIDISLPNKKATITGHTSIKQNLMPNSVPKSKPVLSSPRRSAKDSVANQKSKIHTKESKYSNDRNNSPTQRQQTKREDKQSTKLNPTNVTQKDNDALSQKINVTLNENGVLSQEIKKNSNEDGVFPQETNENLNENNALLQETNETSNENGVFPQGTNEDPNENDCLLQETNGTQIKNDILSTELNVSPIENDDLSQEIQIENGILSQILNDSQIGNEDLLQETNEIQIENDDLSQEANRTQIESVDLLQEANRTQLDNSVLSKEINYSPNELNDSQIENTTSAQFKIISNSKNTLNSLDIPSTESEDDVMSESNQDIQETEDNEQSNLFGEMDHYRINSQSQKNETCSKGKACNECPNGELQKLCNEQIHSKSPEEKQIGKKQTQNILLQTPKKPQSMKSRQNDEPQIKMGIGNKPNSIKESEPTTQHQVNASPRKIVSANQPINQSLFMPGNQNEKLPHVVITGSLGNLIDTSISVHEARIPNTEVRHNCTPEDESPSNVTVYQNLQEIQDNKPSLDQNIQLINDHEIQPYIAHETIHHLDQEIQYHKTHEIEPHLNTGLQPILDHKEKSPMIIPGVISTVPVKPSSKRALSINVSNEYEFHEVPDLPLFISEKYLPKALTSSSHSGMVVRNGCMYTCEGDEEENDTCPIDGMRIDFNNLGCSSPPPNRPIPYYKHTQIKSCRSSDCIKPQQIKPMPLILHSPRRFVQMKQGGGHFFMPIKKEWSYDVSTGKKGNSDSILLTPKIVNPNTTKQKMNDMKAIFKHVNDKTNPQHKK